MRKDTSKQIGFTLMEVVVSVTIFASVVTIMLTLFNQTLRIYRRVEAIRQVTQSVRSVMEFLVKEVRNGRIYYGVSNGSTIDFGSGSSPFNGECTLATTSVDEPVYSGPVTSFALVNVNGERECIYWSHDVGQPALDAGNNNLFIKKEFLSTASQLNPSNIKFVDVSFIVRPQADPYALPSQALQPMVTMMAIVKVMLPTGEIYTIPYQTSVSTYQYDIPKE